VSPSDSTPTIPKSPTYPQRVHLKERPMWQALLKSWEDRIAAASEQLAGLLRGPERDRYERLYAQMLGARDQLADAVRRLPMEVGALYEEDRLRAEEAVSALERLFARWGAGGSGQGAGAGAE
jgi:hypothetical protein